MIIAVIGKGGAGKTTVAALLLRRLLEGGERPVLAIDADPSSCLGSALGIGVERTLAQLRDEMREGRADRPSSMSSGEYLSLRGEEALVEREGFDLLTMGHPEGKGCYCFVNNLIREHLDRLGRAYRHVLLDCEAGLEHLSRRTAGRPDLLLCVCGRPRSSAETIRRALEIYRSLDGQLPPRVDLVLNGFAEGEPEAFQAHSRARCDGMRFDRLLLIPHDPAVAELERAGRSLFELDGSSPAHRALEPWSIGP